MSGASSSTAHSDPRGFRDWLARAARGLLGGLAGLVVVALLDAQFALGRVTDRARAPSLFSIALTDLGVIAPAALVVALVGAALGIVAHPAQPPSALSLAQWLAPRSAQDRLRRAVLVPLAILGAGLWVALSANIARLVMSRGAAAASSGAAVAAGSIACGIGVFVLVLVGGGVVAGATGRGADLPAVVKPQWTIPASMAGVVALLAWGIHAGTTGGDGGWLGIFGVLKRAELDLKAPGLLLLVSACAWLGASVFRRVPAWLALVLALLPLGWTVQVARSLEQGAKVAGVLESEASLGRPLLRLERKLTDRDRDGASAWFGGGDCNDRNPEVNPMASDEPNNGIDEDCSGSDLVVKQEAPQEPAAQKAAEAASTLPSDLNVLLVSIDTLRWDMGYMGYPRPISPSLDVLAEKSVVYEHFYALASYTGKSIGPLMSGKHPSETSRGWSHYNAYPKSDRMVQERLNAAGIRTISVQSHWYFKGWSGMGRGFDVLDMSGAPPGGNDATEDSTSSADRLTDAAIRVLGKPENTGKRFFAWVHYFDPHADYVTHKGTPDFGNKMRDKYDHEVRWTIDNVGRLLDFVAAQPWGAKTAIIVTSDHGEAFQEHGMIRHGFEVWDELVRVPFVLHVPGVPARRIKARRSAVDMVPTILDLFQVRIEQPKDKYDFVSGKSLLPDIALPKGQEPAARDVLVDMPAGPNNDERRAFIHGDQKLTISNGVSFKLFDLAADPGEKNDLSDDKAMLKEARGRYDAFRARLREVRVKRPED